MRDLRLLARLLPVLLPVVLVPVACEDSGGSGGTGVFTTDGGAGFDAATPPEPSSDAAVDAAIDQVAPPVVAVTVTVTDPTGPEANVRVLGHDATGAVIADVRTDATGNATFTTLPSMVTVLTLNALQPGLVTFASVEMGDHLSVVVPLDMASPPRFAQMSVSFTPNAGVIGGASLFQTLVGGNTCSGTSNAVGTPASVDVYPSCLAAANALLVTATNSDHIILGFGFLKGVVKPAQNTIAAVGPVAFAASGQTILTASNLPVAALSTTTTLAAIANGAAFDLSGSQTGALGDGGLHFRTPTGFADAYQANVTAVQITGGVSALSSIVRREAVPAATTLTDIDFSTALPTVTSSTFDSSVPRSDIVLTTSASLATADAGFITMTWNGTNAGSWVFVVPPSTTTFKPPALPADATPFQPASNALISEAVFFEATQLPDYKSVRQQPVTAAGSVDFANPALTLPTNGVLRVSHFVNAIP